ncbi:hypothetical protein P865_01100 [Brucella abortus 82]|nr:hypothetical protein P865_01100 [Brucella abortus 82]
MINAIRVHRTGGPDVLHYEQVEIGEPGPGEARVRHEAVGLNFIDVYFRTGLYKAAKMPFTPGNEGAGIVVAVGAGVKTCAWASVLPMLQHPVPMRMSASCQPTGW